MLVKEFVQALLDEIDALRDDELLTDSFVKLESKLSVIALKHFLRNYLSNDGVLMTMHLNRFSDFLSKRWQFISRTDACYTSNPNSQINKACILLAKKMQHALDRTTTSIFDHYFYLLMPNVASFQQYLKRKPLNDYTLQEFFICEHGQPLDIAKCLEDAVKNKKTTLMHTGDLQLPLSESEVSILKTHCEETTDYYDALLFYVKTNTKNDVIAAQKQLQEALINPNFKVHSSYGEVGVKRITNYILTLVKTPKEFIPLAHEINKEQWQTFITSIATVDLQRLFIRHKEFYLNVQNPDFFSQDSLQNRFILLAFTELYIRMRNEGKEYTSQFAYFTARGGKYLGGMGKYIQSYPKQLKVDAARELQKFLMSDCSLSEIEHYFNHPTRMKFKGPLFESGSDLGSIIEQIKLLVHKQQLKIKYSH